MKSSRDWGALARVEKWCSWLEQVVVGVLGLAALAFCVVQVIGRYVTPHHAMSYAEEAIVYLLVWAVMITSSQLVRRNAHVRSDLVLRLLSQGQQRVLEIFNCVVALLFLIGLSWFGWQVVETSLLLDERSSSVLQFPMWVYYAALPTAGVLMTVRYLVRLVTFLFFYESSLLSAGHIPQHESTLLAGDGEIQAVRT
ncbi:TRAP transporter small permease [Bradyrhizobium sp. 956_D2_N1_4]|jgi:C4-dicarboxylate transporter, DctQ subunit|uniref:TRAP transporter small permease n=1 Tax=Bradyrhizobium sp. 956_D2_N1_4 TaxID=3240375 RepID=UPI003F8AB097